MSSRPNFALAGESPQHFGVEASLTYIWDVPTLSWVKSTGSGGGGGGAATIADGADVAEGTTTDVAWVSGAGTVISLLKKIASAGGSAVSIADGADVVEGALADAAIITDTTGTVNGKLRGLVKHAYERMPAALGQTTMAASLPVTLASNQSGLAVTGTFFQATQPVSAAALPLPAGASTSALQTQPGVDIGDVTINNAAGASAVNVQDGGNSITVDGTVTTTPPANASSNVTQWAGTAVSLNTGVRDAGTLRVTVATNDSVPVTGTVTTTPPANASTNVAQIAGTATDVNSGTKSAGTIRVVLATDQPALTNKLLVTPDSVALPANQSVNAAQLAGTTTDTNSGVKSAGTLRVVLATDQPALTNKLLVTPDSVALPANQSVNVAQFGATNVVTGTGAGGAGIPRMTVSNDSNVIVTPPTLTKGTQGATGFSTQNLKDAGRVTILWTAEFAFAQTAETLLTITESRDGAAVTTFTTKVVTSGKRLRVTSMYLEVETLGTGTTVPQRGYLRMRFNTAGAVTAASPLQAVIAAGAQPPAILKTIGWAGQSFPDGIEFLGDGTKQIGFTLETPDWVVTTQTGRAKVTVTAFEY